ncbi:hypothetical protein [Paraburkholderia domus]|uniref:hypothetical protein n=1 Tax=Paraburkholderia domus TaxID=2793075 RepID=UPI001912E4E4|nr:hypothetical protein [Paraburkholderia domus]MBK5064850.1 hypothetical protein [Burkholderia sp. R-70199]CAE6967607.1 hypothetical protein R70199_07864 [Paraburkholderia domus]
MFLTSGYCGHLVHVSVTASSDGRERIDAQIIHPDGRSDLVPCKSVCGARRVITRCAKAGLAGTNFRTECYRGHFVRVSKIYGGGERVEAQVYQPAGHFELVKCRSIAGAKRVITGVVQGSNTDLWGAAS